MPIKIKSKSDQDPASIIKSVQDAARQEGRQQGRAEMSAAVAEVALLLEAACTKLAEMASIDLLGVKGNSVVAVEVKATRRKRTVMAPVRPGTDQAKVLEIVRAVPGLKGVQIAQQLPNAEERTIRTSLRRLKLKRGLIEQRDDGGWYPVEVAK